MIKKNGLKKFLAGLQCGPKKLLVKLNTIQGTRGNVIAISDIPKRSSYIIIDLSVTGGHQFEFRIFDRSNQSIGDVRGGHAAAADPPTA